MKVNILLTNFLLIISSYGFAQEKHNTILSQLNEAKAEQRKTDETIKLLTQLPPPIGFMGKMISQEVAEAIYFDFNMPIASSILRKSSSEVLSLELPAGKDTMILDLIDAPAYFYNYDIQTSDKKETLSSRMIAKHYRGVVRGKETSSIVAISIFENEMMGIISIEGEGTYNIGKLKGENKHIFYLDKNLKNMPQFNCGTDDRMLPKMNGALQEINNASLSRIQTQQVVKVYIEADYDLYVNKGSNVVATEQFIVGLFNQVAALYQNEGIETGISQIKVWTGSDPYRGDSSSNGLTDFTNALNNNFNGDLAHLVTLDNGSRNGGLAWVDVLCKNSRTAYSNIDTGYASVPNYSWSVSVMTHEMGHNLGSQHTHACVWNGNNTAIDSCAPTTGGCSASEGIPSGGGTIMSYCHLQSVGINFSKGFGSQPGNLIRSRVANSICLRPYADTCMPTVNITGNVSNGAQDIAQASNNIVASNSVSAGRTASYHAGQEVLLTNGFTALAGSVFRGYIEGCSNTYTARPSTFTENESLREETKIKVYPNPSSGFFVIEPEKNIRRYGIDILSPDGRVIFHIQNKEGKQSIDISSSPAGLYLIVVYTQDGKRYSQKIIKK
jgi:hypothetical protein